MANLQGEYQFLPTTFYVSANVGDHEYIPTLNFTLQAFQSASVEFHLNISGSASQGLRFQVNAPSSSLVFGGQYTKGSSENTFACCNIPNIPNTEVPKNCHAGAAVMNSFWKFGIINTGSNVGLVQLSLSRITGGQFLVQTGSFMIVHY